MKNHIKNYIKIMGLAAVPFGTAQATDYTIFVRGRFDGNVCNTISDGVVCVHRGHMERSLGGMRLCGDVYLVRERGVQSVGHRIGGAWTYLRGFHDEKGGRVCVMDTKFSEGKSITRKDVEKQWQKEEVQLRDMFYKCIENGEPKKTFTVDCKIYDLPKGCEIHHSVVLKEKLVDLFFVRDRQRAFGGSEYMLVIVVPDDCETMYASDF